MTVIQSSDYRSALAFTNAVRHGLRGNLDLPVEVKCGNSTFTLTKENFEGLALGVLMAALWEEAE